MSVLELGFDRLSLAGDMNGETNAEGSPPNHGEKIAVRNGSSNLHRLKLLFYAGESNLEDTGADVGVLDARTSFSVK